MKTKDIKKTLNKTVANITDCIDVKDVKKFEKDVEKSLMIGAEYFMKYWKENKTQIKEELKRTVPTVLVALLSARLLKRKA